VKKLEFLTILHEEPNRPRVEALFDRFQKEQKIGIDASYVDWDALWRKLVNISIYKKGADVAEVGTSWLESLVAMNSLRPFSPREVGYFGGKNAFLTSAWETSSIRGDSQVWAIPVRSDVRMIWYWKDMLEEAKVDPATAFETLGNVQQTLDALKSVMPTPWCVATASSELNSIQTLASWIWATDQDFVTANGKQVPLDTPAAVAGLKAYFDLHAYMPKGDAQLDGNKVLDKFVHREIAATVAGPWMLLSSLKNANVPPDQAALVAAALPPGPSFVGGTVLVNWNHGLQNQEVMEFIKFMTSAETQKEYGPVVGLLPATQAAWSLPPYSDDPHYQVLYKALSQGRILPAVPLWGMIEDKLIGAINAVWTDLLTGDEQLETEQVIAQHFEPVINRLNLSLSS
jgi:multiple sugar transport system substrate-binding protein